MQKITRTIGVGIATAALVGATAVSASAGDTTTTFSLEGGTLSVAAEGSATLTVGQSGATEVSGALGNVVVTDDRGGVTGWAAAAATTVFSNNDVDPAMATESTEVKYATGTVSKTGEVTAAGTLEPMVITATAGDVVTATGVKGNNTATWNPTLTVVLPASSTHGTYSGTVTTSVL
ncbi:hypothetical protein [Demequina sp. SO4-18]|uniref:hypothetical protein n=1 Tax=Demequina sp. SO4-18 TaxID=3401026 RepID=UPI003B5AC208